MVLKEIKAKYRHIIEISETVKMYQFRIDGLNVPLKIKVDKFSENSYLAIANLEVKGESQTRYYRRLNFKQSIEDAVEDTLKGFLIFYNDRAKIREVNDFKF